jgi:uncharacterized protein YndB with AHSA1/START domain
MLSVSRTVNVAPETVWDLLVDLDAWPRWGPTVAGATIDGELGVGTRGTVRTAVGVSLPFEVTRFDSGRCWAWKVAGVPATEHTVEPAPGGCTVTFGVPWWAPGYLAVCALALRRLDRLATSG